MTTDKNNAAPDPQPAELAEQQGDHVPDAILRCAIRAFERARKDYKLRLCNEEPQGKKEAIEALSMEAALQAAFALAATGKQQVGEVQGDALSLAEHITDHLCHHEYDIGGRSELLACVTQALAAQAGQGAVPCATSASLALRVAYRHLDMVSMRVSHCKDAAIIESAMKDVDTFDLNAAISALAARQPGPQVPVTTAPQPGKRVSILESACGPARKFDPVAADAELASVPLVPLWELPELHPRKVAAECLTTMEKVRQSTRPNTINRVKLTDAIALVGRFVAHMERSERLGTAPPAQGIDLGPFRPVLEHRRDDILNAVPAFRPDGDYSEFNACIERRLAEVERLLAIVDGQRDAAPGVGNG